MSTARIQPQIEVESATASDILDGLESIKTKAVISGHGVIVNPPGVNGPEEFLSWALLDVTIRCQTINSFSLFRLAYAHDNQMRARGDSNLKPSDP